MNRHDCKEWLPLIEAAVDGELDAREMTSLEMEIADCEVCGQRAAEITHLGDLLRSSLEDVADSMDFNGLWPALEASIEAECVIQLDPLQLQAFADGELDNRELANVAEKISSSEDDRARLSALAEMGELVRMSIEDAADSVDFAPLWSQLDAAVGDEIEAKGGLKVAEATEAPPRAGWFDRLLGNIGGYRAILMSAATAAVVVIMLLPTLLNQNNGQETNQPQQVEIRVFVNEVRSDPGFAVSVDSYSDNAPVIYIRPNESEQEVEPEPQHEPGHEIFDNPI